MKALILYNEGKSSIDYRGEAWECIKKTDFSVYLDFKSTQYTYDVLFILLDERDSSKISQHQLNSVLEANRNHIPHYILYYNVSDCEFKCYTVDINGQNNLISNFRRKDIEVKKLTEKVIKKPPVVSYSRKLLLLIS